MTIDYLLMPTSHPRPWVLLTVTNNLCYTGHFTQVTIPTHPHPWVVLTLTHNLLLHWSLYTSYYTNISPTSMGCTHCNQQPLLHWSLYTSYYTNISPTSMGCTHFNPQPLLHWSLYTSYYTNSPTSMGCTHFNPQPSVTLVTLHKLLHQHLTHIHGLYSL